MQIKVLLFAQLRELIGLNEITLNVANQTTAMAIFDRVTARHPAGLKFKHHCRVAVNQEYQDWQVQLQEGDEVAFIPPVAGG